MHPESLHTESRDYAGLIRRALGTLPCRDAAAASDGGAQLRTLMQHAVDVAWEALSPRGISWIGFYLKDPAGDELVLGPRRDKPACSPIGMHGMCGRAFVEKRPIVVHDVAALGAGYIACDPRDRSEVVIPLFDEGAACWGVLDADSYDVGAFGRADVAGLTELVEQLGLSTPPVAQASILRL